MSFDILKDSLGESRDTYPLTCYLVAGTQAEKTQKDNVIVMKMSNLHKTLKEEQEDEDDMEDEDEDLDEKPELEAAMIVHTGGVNRIRVS